MPQLDSLLCGYSGTLHQGDPEMNIESIAYDSRKVSKNSVFVCVSGFNTDGHEYIAEAIQNGATAIVLERLKAGIPKSIAVYEVKDSRNALAYVSSRFHDIPSLGLKLIGITGSKGKTSVADIMSRLLSGNGINTGIIGSKGVSLNGEYLEMFKSTKTTPESPELCSMLFCLKSMGASHVIIEVTSHALALRRVEYCEFEIGVFTNLYPEHLDFHGTLENYQSSKLRLFAKSRIIVSNADDTLGRRILAENKNTISYSVNNNADYKADDIQHVRDTVRFSLSCQGKKTNIALKLDDNIFVYNYLAAFAACYSLGVDATCIKLKERM